MRMIAANEKERGGAEGIAPGRPRKPAPWVWRPLVSVGLALCAAGCAETRITDPPRTASEQLLISTAADRSLQRAASWEVFKEKRVFLDVTYFDSYDKPYVLGAIRQTLSEHGALLVAEAKDADVVVEPRNGALSTDDATSLIGMPGIPIPIPLTGTFKTPELYLVKSQKFFSTAKLAIFAYDQKTRRHFYSSGPLVGRAALKYYSFVGFFTITRTDIPEKK